MFLKQYNDEPKLKSMNLVLFTDAVNHMMRIARILGESIAFRLSISRNFFSRRTFGCSCLMTATQRIKTPILIPGLKCFLLSVGIFAV